MKYDVMDIRKMSYKSNSFDLIIDKSTLDAMACTNFPELNIAVMLKECQRVLKVGGYYVCVSSRGLEVRDDFFRQSHLDFERSAFAIESSDRKMNYIYVCRKREGADLKSGVCYLMGLNDIIREMGVQNVY